MSNRKFVIVVSVIIILIAQPTTAYADSGGLDLDGYCKSKGFAGVTLIENTAYGWNCKATNGTTYGMDLFDACKWQYGGALPTPKYSDFNDPYSWQCFSENAQPTSTQNSVPNNNSSTNNSDSSSAQSNNNESGNSIKLFTGSTNPPSSGEYLHVNETGLRIRSGPGASNTALGHVIKGNYYPLLKTSGNWGLIQTKRGDGWVSLSYVTITRPSVWCSVTPKAKDLGGGTWNDKNYVLQFDGPNLGDKMGEGKSDLYIYYQSKWTYLIYDGYFNDKTNQWAISTKWAYVNPGWDIDSRWKLDFKWEGKCP
jgi:hypothetical protein